MTDERWGDKTADLLHQTADYAVDFLAGLPERSVRAQATLDELRAGLGGPLPADGEPATDVLRQLRASDAGVMGIAGPRYFGFGAG